MINRKLKKRSLYSSFTIQGFYLITSHLSLITFVLTGVLEMRIITRVYLNAQSCLLAHAF